MKESERKETLWDADVMEAQEILREKGEVNVLLLMRKLRVSPDYASEIMEEIQLRLLKDRFPT